MKIVKTFTAVRSEVAGASAALVPTMGFLHEGHVSLLELAGGLGGPVVMSLFVNPLQFDRPVDLERYPRDLDRDAGIAAAAGVDLLFAPTVEEMYPSPPRTRVRVDSVSEGMEGEYRPGHFEGVATVVAKLFAGIQPEAAVFGRKDAQQLAVVRRLTADLSFPVEIIGAPTVRAPDGLAVSSRNVFIAEDDRAAALGLSSGLFAAAEAVAAGERNGARLESLVRDRLGDVRVEYVSLADAFEAEPVETLEREAFLAVAARVGDVRLIDNIVVWPDGSSDTGVRLERPSILRRM